MKLRLLSAIACTLLSAAVFSQDYSMSDRANILISLVRGEVRHFADIMDSTLYADAKGCDLNGDLFRCNLDAALFFSRYYYGFPSFTHNRFFFNTTGNKGKYEEMRVTEFEHPRIAPAAAEELFRKTIPYLTNVHIRGGDQTDYMLHRIAGYSPVMPTKDYIDLLALIYHQEFASTKRTIIRFEVDRGADQDVQSDLYVYNEFTNWWEIESRLLSKLRSSHLSQ